MNLLYFRFSTKFIYHIKLHKCTPIILVMKNLFQFSLPCIHEGRTCYPTLLPVTQFSLFLYFPPLPSFYITLQHNQVQMQGLTNAVQHGVHKQCTVQTKSQLKFHCLIGTDKKCSGSCPLPAIMPSFIFLLTIVSIKSLPKLGQTLQ